MAKKKTAAKAEKVAKPDTTPHLVVQARAGTGKTFTLVEGLKRIRGVPTPGIVGSPQQERVWRAMQMGPKPTTIHFCAFNRSISEELAKKIPEGCSASTLHSLGRAACTRAFPRCKIEKHKFRHVMERLHDGKDMRDIERELGAGTVTAVRKLTDIARQTLSEPTPEVLEALALHHDIELNGNAKTVYDLVFRVYHEFHLFTEMIDFTDMIWLPVKLNIPCTRYDLLLVDEAQDLNRAQQALAMKSGRRLVLVGDEKQAIYGFAGADTESIPRMIDMLDETDRSCMVLPLTQTRRCGKAIVEAAQVLVPDFEAHESCPEGKIQTVPPEDFMGLAHSGDMALCRGNAPLVSYCFRLIKAGKKAQIQGKEIGDAIIELIDKFKAKDVPTLIEKLMTWHGKEVEKLSKYKDPPEDKIIALDDKRDCLLAFCENVESVSQVITNIRQVFSDEAGDGVRLSSIHKAKGLEAERVFILCPEKLPHPMAKSDWQREQEYHLKYVAITRAINELFWVQMGAQSVLPPPEEPKEELKTTTPNLIPVKVLEITDQPPEDGKPLPHDRPWWLKDAGPEHWAYQPVEPRNIGNGFYRVWLAERAFSVCWVHQTPIYVEAEDSLEIPWADLTAKKGEWYAGYVTSYKEDEARRKSNG